MTAPAVGRRGALVGVLVDLVAPLATFYGLRAAGVGLYLALLAGALASAAGAAWSLARARRITGMTGFAVTTMLLGVVVALLTGSPRFLLAREGWLTAVTGVWFVASIAGRRPLPYLFSRPLLEGRWGWPGDWSRCGIARRGFVGCGGSPRCCGVLGRSPTPRPGSPWPTPCPWTPSRH